MMEADIVALGALCAAIAAIWALIDKALKPIKMLKEELTTLKTDQVDIRKRLDQEFSMLEEQKIQNMYTNKALAALCRHVTTGNNTEALLQVARELDDRIYKKSGSL